MGVCDVKKVLKLIGLFIAMELLLIPLYVFMLIGIVFNDSGYTAYNMLDFLTIPIPIYLYIGATVLLLGAMFWYVRTRWKYRLSIALTHVILIFVIHVWVALFFIPFYMLSYLSDDINMRYNLVYIETQEERETENKQILETQTQEYQDYLSNKEAYSTVYHRDVDGVDFHIMMSKKDDIFYVQYNDGDNMFFKPIETVVLPVEDNSHVLKERLKVESNPHEIELYVFYEQLGHDRSSDRYYVYVADMDTTIGLDVHETRDVSIMIDDVRWGLNDYTQKQFVEYMSLDMYDISYKNGQIIRSGSIGDDVSWNIKGDNGRSLSRFAGNETALDLNTLDEIFQKGATYTVYMDSYVDIFDTYKPVSETITFVYE